MNLTWNPPPPVLIYLSSLRERIFSREPVLHPELSSATVTSDGCLHQAPKTFPGLAVASPTSVKKTDDDWIWPDLSAFYPFTSTLKLPRRFPHVSKAPEIVFRHSLRLRLTELSLHCMLASRLRSRQVCDVLISSFMASWRHMWGIFCDVLEPNRNTGGRVMCAGRAVFCMQGEWKGNGKC